MYTFARNYTRTKIYNISY